MLEPWLLFRKGSEGRVMENLRDMAPARFRDR